MCSEKNGNEKLLCNKCSKFPCLKIRKLDKRYTAKYGESPIENLRNITNNGLINFVKVEKEKWKCSNCGNLLCVHRGICLICGTKNNYFPDNKKTPQNGI